MIHINFVFLLKYWEAEPILHIFKLQDDDDLWQDVFGLLL